VLEDEMCLGAGAATWAGGGSDRRKKRMIKNRESAARSRARKQAYVRELERKVQMLQDENESLRVKYDQVTNPSTVVLSSLYICMLNSKARALCLDSAAEGVRGGGGADCEEDSAEDAVRAILRTPTRTLTGDQSKQVVALFWRR
jgi:hypothetical protein